MPKQGVFVVHMVHVGFALLKAAMLVSMLVDYAKRMVANQSALGSGAPQPPIQGDGVPNTAVKEPAHQRGVKQMSKPADYAQNMAEMEAAASRNAFVTFKIVDCAYTTEGKRLDGASILAAASRL